MEKPETEELPLCKSDGSAFPRQICASVGKPAVPREDRNEAHLAALFIWK
jgi:hypothetical protein